MAVITIGANNYDSFISVADADVYLAADISRGAAWLALSDDPKARGLISATRMLLALTWCDTAPDPADDDAPQVVQDVTAMLAADLVAKPKLFADASANSNVKRAKGDTAEVEFFSPVSGAPPLPLALWNRLLAAGLVCLGTIDDDVTLDGAIPTGTSDCIRPLSGRYPWDWPIAAGDYD
jgi:hypothetical protein